LGVLSLGLLEGKLEKVGKERENSWFRETTHHVPGTSRKGRKEGRRLGTEGTVARKVCDQKCSRGREKKGGPMWSALYIGNLAGLAKARKEEIRPPGKKMVGLR